MQDLANETDITKEIADAFPEPDARSVTDIPVALYIAFYNVMVKLSPVLLLESWMEEEPLKKMVLCLTFSANFSLNVLGKEICLLLIPTDACRRQEIDTNFDTDSFQAVILSIFKEFI